MKHQCQNNEKLLLKDVFVKISLHAHCISPQAHTHKGVKKKNREREKGKQRPLEGR